MGKQRSPKQLGKFLAYVLGRRPDEFGLIPDSDGYVKIKELLKAICEEEGWSYVRRASLNEVLVTLPDSPIEIEDNRIRAKNREQVPEQTYSESPPKLLYTCVRQKAHPFVMDKGIFPQGYPNVVLSSDRNLAERMGKRSDQSPVLLTVQAAKSMDMGVVFFQAGECLYLADFIPQNCFTGPPLPKQKEDVKSQEKPASKPEQKFPGSFFIDLTEEKKHKKQAERKRKRKDITKEKEKRRLRKQKKTWTDL
ncbi:MAG: hypothetical protein B6245_17770 [Desulfobacteraceae bacterium 4572_88]|nr:MAG: hypothetical protein B6245_17770 [Desulfobacteraceae bacterium 4572_88]